MNEFYRKAAIKSSLLRVLIFLVGIIFVVVVFEGFGILMMERFFPKVEFTSPWFFTIARGMTLIATLVLIYFLRKKIDRRPFLTDWFSFTKRKHDLLIGFIAGALLIMVASFILGQLGMVEFYPGKLSFGLAVQYLVLFFVGALWEEIVFRGYIQHNLMQDMHPLVALVITSVLFMLLHSLNHGIDTLPRINLFLAGMMLGVSFLFSKNLWFPLGLHWSWNLFQGPIFGFEVSGLRTESMFRQEIRTPNLWTGDEFGFEGSILATILIVVSSIIIYLLFRKFAGYENS